MLTDFLTENISQDKNYRLTALIRKSSNYKICNLITNNQKNIK
jgi:hypothetical protein